MVRSACIALAMLSFACSGSGGADAANPCADAGAGPTPDASVADASPMPDAATDAADAGPCAMRIDSITPDHISAKGGVRLIKATGCGFTRVTSVEVNVADVPMTVLDDHTIVFTAPELDPTSVEPFPYRAEVDFRNGLKEVAQTFLTYE